MIGRSLGDTDFAALCNTYWHWLCRDFLHWGTLAVAAQIIFGFRFVMQWIVSERNGKSVVPPWFWYTSLAGGVMLAVYAVARDAVVLVSTVPTIVIYARNILLIHRSRSQAIHRIGLLVVGSTILLGAFYHESVGQWISKQAGSLMTDAADWAWFGFGFTAQLVFFTRFVWQWIVSERRKESVVPVGFWYISIAGGAMLTAYYIFRDPILVFGQAPGLVVYVRNLMLIHRSKVVHAGPERPTDERSAVVLCEDREAA